MTRRQDFDNPFWLLRFAELGWTREQAADYLDISLTTIRRYESGRGRIKGSVLRALMLRAGHLGEIHPDFRGWKLFSRDGRLYPPGYRYGLSAGDILAEVFRSQLLSCLQQKVRALEEQLQAHQALFRPVEIHAAAAANDAEAEARIAGQNETRHTARMTTLENRFSAGDAEDVRSGNTRDQRRESGRKNARQLVG